MSSTSTSGGAGNHGGGPPKDFPNDPNRTPKDAYDATQLSKRVEGRSMEAGVHPKDFAYAKDDPKHDRFATESSRET